MDVETSVATLNVVCPHCHTGNRVPQQRLGEQPRCGACKAPLFGGQPVELDAAAFERHVTTSDLPVVVDFWAPWCAPCRMMAPIFAGAVLELEPHVRLVKVNTDEAQQLAMRFGIRSIPTLAIFKGGKEHARTAGVMDGPRFVAWVRAHA